MKEIKFRAWDDGNKMPKRMIYSDDFKEPYQFDNLVVFWAKACGRKVMQFTGLKDKNGKDIYEGDIVKNKHRENIFVIEWDNNNSSFTQRNGDRYLSLFLDWAKDLKPEYNLEVIGNIYENPELVEEENG